MLLRWIGVQTTRVLNRMKITIIILMFFVTGALIIISNNNLSIYNHEDLSEFSKLYLEWINRIYINAQSITGEIVKQEWLPEMLP